MRSPNAVDINADVGEGCGFDAALMPSITSANIAAGFHAGTPELLRETIRLAIEHGVRIGAHPGFRDREHFGRRELSLDPPAVHALVAEQLARVAEAAAAAGATMTHVKPHGALYNMAARDRALADLIAQSVAEFDRELILFAPAYSQLRAAGEVSGLRVYGEVFADRAYAADGSLVPRGQTGAVIHGVAAVVERAVRMAADRCVEAIDGSVVRLDVDTICVHGDTPRCDVLAANLRAALERAGMKVGAF